MQKLERMSVKAKKPSVLILHGWQGSPAPHWQGWLASELEKLDYKVSFPQLSNNAKPEKEVWIKEAVLAFKHAQADIVVAHSMGNTLWFHLCSLDLVTQVQKLFLVAPPRDLTEYEDVKSFFPAPKPENLHAKEVMMICSDNDPYMDLSQSQSLAQALNCPLTIVKDAGHINSDSNYGPWPWMLKQITDLSL